MNQPDPTVQFLDATVTFEFHEVVHLTGLSNHELAELAERGVLHSVGGGRYAARVVQLGRRAAQLRDDFELDIAGLALALSLLERIDALEARLHQLTCESPR